MRFIYLFMLLTMTLGLSAKDFYVNSKTGHDSNNGQSPQTAWKTVQRASQRKYLAGDRLLLARGSVFKGRFYARGKGQVINGKMKPIKLIPYGEGKRPIIHGEGKVLAPVIMRDVEGWEVSGLELTNKGAERKPQRYGIFVENANIPVARHIVIKNLFVHDVNGALPKDNGASTAIFIRIKPKSEKALRFDRVLIEANHIKDCSRNGIVLNVGTLRDNWNPSTNVVIRKNLIEGVGGDGILPTGCDGVLVEWNVMRDCPYLGEEGGAAAGMWPWNCDNAVFQYNEVTDHKAWVDGQAYDCDYSCKNTLYQYNLSYENYGGFMLVCAPGYVKKGWLKNNALNYDSVIRFNLSLDDGGRDKRGKKAYKSPVFSITGGSTKNTKIYGNIIARTKQKHSKEDHRLLEFGDWGGRTAVGTKIFNNIFIFNTPYKGKIELHKTIRDTELSKNQFYGNWQDFPKHNHFKTKGNVVKKQVPEVVTLKGTKEQVTKFKKFLEKKGNPQEERGIKIKWVVIK